MKAFIFALFAVALAADSFSAFEARYGKNYLPSERAFRAKVYEYNMAWADKVNAEGHPYTVGATPFADMTNTEFATSKMCGCMLKSTKVHKPAAPIMEPAVESIDWREKGAVTPVKNQLGCGSCWAFSATGALEAGHFIANGELISLSEQQLVDCDPKSYGCNGGEMYYAFEYVMNHGICTEEEYPYHSKDEDCKDNKCTVVVKNKGFEMVEFQSGVALKQAVSKFPVSIGVEADSAVFQMYKTGVLDSTACGVYVNHGVLAVGFTEDYWIVKNSWGSDWGDGGYIKIKYDAEGDGICGINRDNTYPTF